MADRWVRIKGTPETVGVILGQNSALAPSVFLVGIGGRIAHEHRKLVSADLIEEWTARPGERARITKTPAGLTGHAGNIITVRDVDEFVVDDERRSYNRAAFEFEPVFEEPEKLPTASFNGITFPAPVLSFDLPTLGEKLSGPDTLPAPPLASEKAPERETLRERRMESAKAQLRGETWTAGKDRT